MKTIIILIVTFSAFATAFGQKAQYKIKAKNRQLVVSYQGKSHALNVSEQIDAAKVTDTIILFAARKDDFTYLVVDVSGWSRKKQNDRQCGAGEESNLIWIKLDAQWKIADIKSERYESCWATTTSSDGYKIDGATLLIEIDNFRTDKNIILHYDANQPEKGFQIQEKPIENK